MPIAALLATYGAALKLELGGRAVQELAVRVAEGAANKVRDDVKTFTGKETCEPGPTNMTTHPPSNTRCTARTDQLSPQPSTNAPTRPSARSLARTTMGCPRQTPLVTSQRKR